MKPPLMRGSPDDFQTPAWAIEPLLPYIKKEWIIWECAQGKGLMTEALSKRGLDVIGSDILDGRDFLVWEPNYYDCIITNPPYRYKLWFLRRAYQLQKPFAFLLPLTTFETRDRQVLFMEKGLQVIFMSKRVNFETPTGRKDKESSAWFSTAWFTNGLKLPRDMMFYDCNDKKA